MALYKKSTEQYINIMALESNKDVAIHTIRLVSHYP